VTGWARHGVEVLDRDRYAEERRVVPGREPLIGCLRGGARLVVVAPDDRVERRVELVDSGQARVEQLNGGELTCAQRRGVVESGSGRSEGGHPQPYTRTVAARGV